MKTNRAIIDFIEESNRIEGYDIPNMVYAEQFNTGEINHTINSITLEEHKLVENSHAAWKFVEQNSDKNITEKRMLKLHSILMEGLLQEEYVGAIKPDYISVSIGGRKTCSGSEARVLLRAWYRKFNNPNIKDDFGVHSEFEYIHPFADGNGRMGRLLWAWRLLKNGHEIFPFLQQFDLEGDSPFQLKRRVYYTSLQRYSETRDLTKTISLWEGISRA